VLPKALQLQAIKLAHIGHQGLVKTKQLLRTKVWFPHIEQLVERTIQSCIPCQAVTDKTHREPLQMTELPSASWKEVAADFKGPLSDGKYLLVVIDLYSRYPFVRMVSSSSVNVVIPKLDELFAEQGIPMTLITDNGPPFSSAAMTAFAEHLGFTHRRVTPLWPQANGEAERMMKTINKVIQTATLENTPVMKALTQFLRNYRATPHSTTGKSPATLLLGRDIKTCLPEVERTDSVLDEDVRKRDTTQKAKMKRHADNRHHLRPVSIAVGDNVLVRQNQRNKATSTFDPVPYVVSARNGTSVTAVRSGHKITRNVFSSKRFLIYQLSAHQTRTTTIWIPSLNQFQDDTMSRTNQDLLKTIHSFRDIQGEPDVPRDG
jgi:transposase InsO family protein